MDTTEIATLARANLTFNAPLSDARAAALVASLQPLAGTKIVDLGCGWAELLLRTLETEPTAVGVGVDTDAAAIQRARANAAARGLADRSRFVLTDASAWAEDPADIVVCIGASHAWSGTQKALQAIRPLLRPGGRLVFGEGYWQRSPTPQALTALGVEPDAFGSLAELVDLATGSGYRLLTLSRASTDEWDVFESGWCGGLERWLLRHPGAPHADRVRVVADEHRQGWLRGYRDVLGFAYLTLAVPQ